MPTVKLRATGKAAHAGNHHQDGANAIWALAQVIDRVAGESGVRFTAIEGGTSRNTVPDSAVVTLECSESVLADLDLGTDVAGATLTLER